MDREWHQIDKVGIARFIDPNVTRLLPLEQSVFDLKQQFPQDFTPVIELLYNKLRERQIWYAAEKGITVTGSQKIRRPDEILNGNREATCLDLALLFCALCLGYQLLPIFILLDSHALVAVSVKYQAAQWDDPFRPQIFQLQNGPVTDANVLRQLVDSGEYILVECTGFARSEMIPKDLPEGEGRVEGLLTFQKAVEAGRKQLDCQNRSLIFALDVDMAHRLWGVKPYAANWQDTAHTLQEQLRGYQELLANFNQQLLFPIAGTPANLADERHSRIEYGCKLINQGQPKQALEYLTDLKTELWHKADAIIKYRLLANIGMARLVLEQIADAAAAFLEARQYNPEDEKALALAAMGYMYQGNYDRAEELIQVVLQKNPANSIAHSLRVEMAPATDTLEAILNRVPSPYRDNPYVMAALGKAALDRESYTQAEGWFQTVINQSEGYVDNIKLFLGITLMKSVAQDFSHALAGQLDALNKTKLERAVDLFTGVLGGTHPSVSELHPLNLAALVNRSGVLRLLNNQNEAIHDIELALQVEPNNPQLIKQLALLAYEKGDKTQAINDLQKIISNRETPEASLLAASFMMEEGRFVEASEVLEQFQLNGSGGDELKTEAKRLQLQLYLEIRDYDKARKISQLLLDEEPNNLINLVCKIHILIRINGEEDEDIKVLVEQAKASLEVNNNVREKIILANLLYDLKHYRDAVKVYERFVDKRLNNQLTHRLLNAYYYAGDYGSALDLCQQLLSQHGSIPYVSEMATFLYQTIDDSAAARELCEEYLKFFPNDISMQLRLALVNYDTDRLNDLDHFLDSNPSIDTLSIEACQHLIDLYKVRDRWHHFFDTLYETRRRFYDEGQVHAFYVISYMEGKKLQPETPSQERVESGCAVLLRDEFNSESWYILDARPDAELTRHELGINQPLYQKLLGKTLDDKIILAEDLLGQKTITIVAITNKYFAAGKQSLELLEKLPNIKGFRSGRVPMSEESGIEPEWLQRFDEMLKKREEDFNTHKSCYRRGDIPFGTLAILTNENPVKLWGYLVGGTDPYVHCWSNPNEKFDEALALLKRGGLVVIDVVSLLTLYWLGVADDVVRVLGKFGIAQSTLELLRREVEESQGFESDGFLTADMVNGQRVMRQFTPEYVAQRRTYFEQLIGWVRSNCYILPCRRALTMSRDEREKRNEVLGFSFVDTLLIASEPGRILYSDDQWLRYFARVESGVGGVWTQLVLNYCLQQKYLDNAKYYEVTQQLINWGYDYTLVDADILLEGARQAGWNPQIQYLAVLKVLEDERTSADYIPFVATEFLYKLYNEDIVPHYRDYLILELLKAIKAKMFQRRSIIERLIYHIQKKFALLPTRKKEILGLIRIWQDTQTIVT
jgi:tetratricopeptide (TPR) repeat protein